MLNITDSQTFNHFVRCHPDKNCKSHLM